jgi:hypothetical protein
MKSWKSPRPVLSVALLAAWIWLAAPPEVAAFCGFYVGKADSSLYNEASQVVLARNANRTVISMMNDYKGELTEFALVVPVPVVLEQSQIHIGDREIFKHLDAYSAPRLEPLSGDVRQGACAAGAHGGSDARGELGPREGARCHGRGAIHGR